MFTKFKEKIVKDYCYLTILLLLFVSFSLYIVGFSISYKSQLSHIKMLAIEESEDLFYKINTKDLKNFPKDDDNSPEEDNYFNKIFIYGYTKDHQLVFEHNNMEWSEKSITKIINDNSLSFHKVYFDFNLVDNRHLKYLIYMRYPLLENNIFLGEVYVGIEITHWVREQIRIFFILLIIISNDSSMYIIFTLNFINGLLDGLKSLLENKNFLFGICLKILFISILHNSFSISEQFIK